MLVMLLAAEPAPGPLETVKTWVEIIGGTITAIAVLVGGGWAYFKFIKGRVFGLRLETGLTGTWHDVGGVPHLLAQVTIKNIGSTTAKLVRAVETTERPAEYRAYLEVLRLSARTPEPDYRRTYAKATTSYTVCPSDAWIEPGESLCDEVLIPVDGPGPIPVQIRLESIWENPSWRGKDLRLVRTRILLPRGPTDDVAADPAMPQNEGEQP